jgi:hypothetical protein
MHIFISAYIRIIAERPQLNRFVINNRLYARNGIFVSMAIKRSLHDEGEETTVKFAFTGRENIFEIVEIINKTIADSAPAGSKNAADRIAEGIMSLPNPLVNALVGVLKGMDRHNLLPGSIVEASPFHTTLFFTYLKSIKLDYIYHHLYDFGTTGIFAALGKVKKMPVVEGDQMVVRRCCEVGYTMDERLCDGLYFANSIKLAKRYLENPYLLEAGLIDIVKDVP